MQKGLNIMMRLQRETINLLYNQIESRPEQKDFIKSARDELMEISILSERLLERVTRLCMNNSN